MSAELAGCVYFKPGAIKCSRNYQPSSPARKADIANWAFIEKGGEQKAGEWTKATEDRLKKFVTYGHRLGYFVGFYCLDGFTDAENQGWDPEYNFGSREKVMPRWQALVRAHADFISTDHYGELASVIRSTH